MKKIAWKLFLGIYIIVLLLHVRELAPETFLIPFLLGGFILAVIAHARRHWSSIPFLVLHMVLEAIEFSSSGFSLGGITLFWILVHIGMDVGFLWDEIRRHFPYARYILFSSILIAVATIYAFFPTVNSSGHGFMELYHAQIELFVIGGVIGCVISHLIPHKHIHA
jgi:hypothetical protein